MANCRFYGIATQEEDWDMGLEKCDQTNKNCDMLAVSKTKRKSLPNIATMLLNNGKMTVETTGFGDSKLDIHIHIHIHINIHIHKHIHICMHVYIHEPGPRTPTPPHPNGMVPQWLGGDPAAYLLGFCSISDYQFHIY